METIFTLPLFLIAALQTLLAALLLAPAPVSLPVAQLWRSLGKSTGTSSVVMTVTVVLLGLLVSSLLELSKGHARAQRADVREVVHSMDFLRSQVSCVLCMLNLALLTLGQALGRALCAVDLSGKNLDALKRQVKGLQAEYQRVTSLQDAPAAKDGSQQVSATQQQLDGLVCERQCLQASLEAAEKAQLRAEASVNAMKSQMKGFDTEFDRLLEENKLLKRKLAGAGDAHYAAEVGSTTKKGD